MPAGCWGSGEGHNATRGSIERTRTSVDGGDCALASEYGRYGYRRITVKLREAGWPVGTDRVQRIWRREGLKVPQKQRPRGRLWLNDGSCVRLRSERANQVWSYDFVKRDDARREVRANADADRRIHAGVLSDPCGPKAGKQRSDRGTGRWMLWRGIRNMFVPITDRSLWPGNYGSGWGMWGRARSISSRAVPGKKTGTARASTESCGTNA